jgi:hypothetical protein
MNIRKGPFEGQLAFNFFDFQLEALLQGNLFQDGADLIFSPLALDKEEQSEREGQN